MWSVKGLISVTSLPFNPSPADLNPLAGISRCIRRICLLREQGDTAEAALLEQSDLANAVRDIRLARGPDALPESELRSMFVTEEKRVTDAIILSELLIPELVKSFSSAASNPPMPRPANSGPAPAYSSDSVPPFAQSASVGGPAIADFLDSMLASERSSRRR